MGGSENVEEWVHPVDWGGWDMGWIVDYGTLSYPQNTVPFTEQIARSDSLAFTAYNDNGDPRSATFQLFGLSEHLPELTEVCL